MPRTSTRRLSTVLAAVSAAALVPLTVAPATAAAAPAPVSTSVSTQASAAVRQVVTAPRPTIRWVKVDRATVTVKRDRSSRVVARPADGTRLRVVDRSAKLLKVRLPSGKEGWIGKRAVTSTPLSSSSGTRYTTQRVKVTQQVGPGSRTVGHAALGTKVKRQATTTGRSVNRVKVKLPDGRTGWVSANRLTQRDVWGSLARCESGNRPRISTGNGYYGMYQFSARTWRSVGGKGLPHQHGAAEQTKRAQILQERAGWGQWPACTRKLGLR